MIVIGCEVAALFLFWMLAKLNKNGNKNKISFVSVMKGLIERAFITFTLVIHLPQSLTLFAALKIATRIKDEDKVSNDFYLLGNLIICYARHRLQPAYF